MYQDIVTLGPEGTDAECVARNISNRVFLCDSFRDSMKYAYDKNKHALISAGYIRKNENGAIIDCWVDINFLYIGKMELVDSFFMPTKEMCLAKHVDAKNPESLVIHPSTEMILQHFSFPVPKKLMYTDSKPNAVNMVRERRADMCLGSRDVIEKCSELVILDVINPHMVWTVYKKIDNKEANEIAE